MKASLAAVALTALALPAIAHAKDLPTTCRDKPVPELVVGEAFSIDGDTIAIAGKPHIRIWGIQAPELRDKKTGQETVPGMRARAALEELLKPARHQVSCAPTKWDRYCRLVAICDTAYPSKAIYAESIELGWTMLDAGLAYGFYLDDAVAGRNDLSRSYATAESMARAERRGLWKEWLGEK